MDRFLKYNQYRPSEPLEQNIASYLEAIERDSRFADSQVKQAADAILLYADKYLKSDKRHISLSINSSVGPILDVSNKVHNMPSRKEIIDKFPPPSPRLSH